MDLYSNHELCPNTTSLTSGKYLISTEQVGEDLTSFEGLEKKDVACFEKNIISEKIFSVLIVSKTAFRPSSFVL